MIAVAVCNYQRYGRGGGQETKGALCILSLNMINDKVTHLHHDDHHYDLVSGVRHPLGLALRPHSGRHQQNRHQEHPADVQQSEILPDEDDDAQVTL